MNRLSLLIAVLSLPLLGLLPACESDFVADPSRPRPTRAVQDPTYHNSPEGEVFAGTEEGVPLVTVDASNKPGENPKVRTIADVVNDTLNPPTTTAPANTSTPGQPSRPGTGIRVDPVTGVQQ